MAERRLDLRREMARRASQAALIAGAAAMPETFQRTLAPRSTVDQALVSGLTLAIAQGLVSTVQETLQSLTRPVFGDDPSIDGEHWSRRALAGDLALAVAGAAVRSALRSGAPTNVWLGAGHTAGWLVGSSGLAGLVTGAVQEFARLGDDERAGRRTWLGMAAAAAGLAGSREYRRRRRSHLDEKPGGEDVEISASRSLGLAVVVAVGATGAVRLEGVASGRLADALARALPGEQTAWRPVGHLASLAAVVLAGRAGAQRVFHSIEGMNTGFEAALDVAPRAAEVSGSPDSLLPFATMSRMGRRMVWTVRRPPEIERVMGEPAVAHPVRVYGGLELADTPEERVRLTLDDLDRAGGLDRAWLLVASPTGTGYVNYAALGALEFLTRGDCAAVALQYGARPSALSLDRVDDGREQFRILIDALGERLAHRSRRPKVLVFGESLGAWTSQDAFLHQGTDGLIAADIDHALWIGTPFGSKWKDQVLLSDRPDVDPDLVGVFNDISEWQALDADAVARLRFVMLTHNNDGVARFGQQLLVQPPDWLGPPATRPPGVPRSQRWVPVTTFIQTLVDMKNAARVVPGQFAATGHDYRADLAPFMQAVLDLPATDEQLQRIQLGLEAEEALRTRWIAEHGRLGSSMAAELIRRVRTESPEAFEQAFQSLRDDFGGWRDEWGAERREASP